MNTKLIMLGTGNALVTQCYNTCFAIKQETEYFLVDAGGGNGILTQMEKAKIPFEKVRAMFISHAHTDHVLGTIWVIRIIASRIRSGQYDKTFHVYCHEELAALVQSFCRELLPAKLVKLFQDKIKFHVIEDGQEVKKMGIQFRFFDIGSVKAKQFGFRAQLPDGQSLTFLGDEPFHRQNYDQAVKSDWLMSEAFCLYEERERFNPYEKSHSTARDAGKSAAALKAGRLILFHTEDSDLQRRKERYTREAALEFSGPVYVPDDLEEIELK
ncbi:MAG: MBL fold metallo-hydrolase [Ruminococcus sp.]